ncbi:MAG: hypothetical protein Q8O39_02500 [bacterium]|nr:hypothetical protein [bacterium]
MDISKTLKILALVVIIGGSIAGYWFYQKTIYSKEVLKVEILGPEKIAAGEEFEYTIKYKNNGNFRLENLNFNFQFPDQAIVSEEENQNSLRVVKDLEDLYPGEEKFIRYRARIFGTQDSIHTAYATIGFNPKDLNANYQVKTSLSTKIDSMPITFDFDLPSKAMNEKPLNFSINYFSNIDYPLSDLRIKLEYPAGFQFLEGQPLSIENDEWAVPILNKVEGGRISIKGQVSGSAGDSKLFKAKLGFWKNDKYILLKETSKATFLTEASIYITQFINNSPQYNPRDGELLHYEIFFRNVGGEALEDLSMLVKLDGNVFDLDTLKSDTGKYNSGDNFIIWSKRESENLQFLDVNQEGKAEFWVELKDDWPLANNAGFNQIIRSKISVGQTNEEFSSKVVSKLAISSQVLSSDNAYFNNSGPYPPQVGEYSTLTVVLNVKNYFNAMKNVKLRAVLPRYIDLTGQISPSDSKLVFDQKSREMIWDIGDMGIGKGVLTKGPEIAFQVRIKPDLDMPLISILGGLSVDGDDQFTGSRVEEKLGDVVLDTQAE